MWFWVVAVLGAVVGLIHFIFPKKYRWPSFWKLLDKIPGPPTIPFFGTATFLEMDNSSFLSTLVKLVNEYGPLIKLEVLGNISIITTDVNHIETIMNSKQHITKSVDYNIIHPWLGEGLLTSTGAKWFTRRRQLTPAFHFGIIDQYLEVFHRNSQVLVDKIRSNSGKPLEISPLVSLCTLDIICETAMGTIVNAQLGGEKEYVKAVLEMSKLFQVRQLTPWYYRDIIFHRLPAGKKQLQVLKILHGFTDKVVQEKIEAFAKKRKESKKSSKLVDDMGVKKKRSFLDLLVETSESDGTLTQQEIREEVDTFMFEGHDTTAAALSWALYELGLNPDLQAIAREEQDSIFGGSKREATSHDLAEMKYLDRVIKETLRLYPSVPLVGRELEQNVKLGEYEVPAGAGLGIFIYAVHRDPTLYPDPDKFNPDRFIPERIAKRHPYSYIPFSAGPRNCIGQKFAMTEEKLVLSQILRNFTFKSLTPREDLHLMGELILRPKQNVQITFTPRD